LSELSYVSSRHQNDEEISNEVEGKVGYLKEIICFNLVINMMIMDINICRRRGSPMVD
jgi:hypothetical protein